MILALISLFVPLAVELYDDRKGDSNKKVDVAWRLLFACLSGFAGWILIGKSPWLGFFLSLAIHWFFFDYLINLILIRNHVLELPKGETWYSYIGKSSSVDRIKWWRNLGATGRFLVKLVVLIGAMIIWI